MRRGAHTAKAKITFATLVIASALRAAPQVPAVLPKDPNVGGRDAIILEVEGTPPLQVGRTGDRLPPAVQEHIAGGGDLDLHQSSLAAVAIGL